LPDLELPYVFGGDGATVLLPGERRTESEAALRGVKKIAVSTFDLELRVGIVPVGELVRAGYPVRVGRFRVSPRVRLAMFSGSGFSWAERWVKSPTEGPRFAISEDGPDTASLEGFECRWQPVKSRRGQIASLIVMAVSEDDAERARIYRHTINTLEDALEDDAGHPISLGGLRLGAIFGDFSIEARLRSGQAKGAAYDAARKHAHNKSLIGRTLIGLKSQAGGPPGRAFRRNRTRHHPDDDDHHDRRRLHAHGPASRDSFAGHRHGCRAGRHPAGVLHDSAGDPGSARPPQFRSRPADFRVERFGDRGKV
jgi:hypothetical protein